MEVPPMTIETAVQRARLLTARERDVIRACIAVGVKGACRQLYITIDTLKDHKRLIIKRLGARNWTHAVAIAWRVGVVW